MISLSAQCLNPCILFVLYMYYYAFLYGHITTVNKPRASQKSKIIVHILPQRICYSHWANGAQNRVISIGQWVCLIMKKAPSDSPIWQLKKRELLLPLSFLITKSIKLDLSNPHYQPHYRRQGCVIREKNITAPFTNPIKDHIKDTLVPLQTILMPMGLYDGVLLSI